MWRRYILLHTGRIILPGPYAAMMLVLSACAGSRADDNAVPTSGQEEISKRDGRSDFDCFFGEAGKDYGA